ncbi:MAG: PilZ domain-containing protein [Phycisphaeraceae bacterium]
MRFFRNPILFSGPQQPDNKRRHGRLRTRYLYVRYSNGRYGRVLDLSVSGMRVQRAGTLRFQDDDLLPLILECNDTLLPIKARVAWTRKVGFFKFLLGLEFVDLGEAELMQVKQLAQVAADCLFVGMDTPGRKTKDNESTAA